jgi:hypothetical protein
MHGFTIELNDHAGKPVPLSVLHHVKVMSRNRRELFNPIMLRVVGAGSETRAAQIPRAFGYPMRQGDSLLVTAILHNPTTQAYRGVRVKVALRYSPLNGPPDPLEVFPFFTHVTPPDSTSSYDLPPGRSERSRLIHPAIAGRIIGMGGHMHEYGVQLRFEDVTANKVIWEVEPKRDSSGAVVEVPSRLLLWRAGVRIRPDHVYRVTGVYFNPTGDTIRNGGMATVGGAFMPATRASWPTVEHSDPLFSFDLQQELNSGQPVAGRHTGH